MADRLYVWGADIKVEKVSFGFAGIGWQGVEVDSLRIASGHRDGERLGLLDRQLRIYARQMDATYPCAAVFVEQPSGRFENLPLKYACGVIQAALAETLKVPVLTVTSSDWKKTALGIGNATKAQVGHWVRTLASDIYDEDECDAYGIAWACRRRVATEAVAA